MILWRLWQSLALRSEWDGEIMPGEEEARIEQAPFRAMFWIFRARLPRMWVVQR